MSLDFDSLFPTLNGIKSSGKIRSYPEDFQVTELSDIALSGEGEHLWLYIQKKDSNTDWVAKQLANICQVPRKQVSFAGLKDRHAITKQWFSIQLAKISSVDEIQSALPEEITILKSDKHRKKIKIGQLDANQFCINIRDVVGDKQNIEDNIAQVIENGVPNYFGPQRFGLNMGNIQKATDWFLGKYKPKTKNLKSLLISTARSHIFNAIVAQRIKSQQFYQPIKGDIFQLNGNHSWFNEQDASDIELTRRLKAFDIHITAAMWGENQVQSQDKCAVLENTVAQQFPNYLNGLNKFRLRQDRRSIRISASQLTYQWINDEQLLLKFQLPAGCYATSIIREIIDVS